MSAHWTPSSTAPPPPSRASSAFRSTLVVAGVALAGAVGLVVWGGGDGPAVAGPSGQVPGGPTIPGALAGGDAATVGASPGVAAATEGADAAVAAVDAPTAATAATAGPGATGSYEVDVGMQDALIGMLPVPAGATELPADGAGVRSWTVAGTDWQAARDAYLVNLTGAGYTYVMTESIDDSSGAGELYTLTHSSGPTLQLAVGTFGGQSIIEVTRQ